MKNATFLALVAMTFALGALLTCALEGCELHNPPPCAPGAVFPDPCAAAPRDAGVDG